MELPAALRCRGRLTILLLSLRLGLLTGGHLGILKGLLLTRRLRDCPCLVACLSGPSALAGNSHEFVVPLLRRTQALIGIADSLLVILGLQGLLLRFLFLNLLLGHCKLLLGLRQLLSSCLLLCSQFSRPLPGHSSLISLLLSSLHDRIRTQLPLRLSRLRLHTLLRSLPVALLLIRGFLARWIRSRSGLLLISLLLGIARWLLLLLRIACLLLSVALLLLISLQLLLIRLLLRISLRVHLLGLRIWALLVSSLQLGLPTASLGL